MKKRSALKVLLAFLAVQCAMMSNPNPAFAADVSKIMPDPASAASPQTAESVSNNQEASTSENNAEDVSAEPNPELISSITNSLINEYTVDDTAAASIAQSIVEGHPEARSVQIQDVKKTDTEVVVDFKYDGNESSVVYDVPVTEDIEFTPPAAAQEPNDIGFFVGGELVQTSLGPVTVQTASLPIGYTESAGRAPINDSTTQYKAWSMPNGEYTQLAALIDGNDLELTSREPVVTALINMFQQYAAGETANVSENESTGGDATGVIEAINTLFPTEESDGGYMLSDPQGNYYPVTRYVTYLDLTAIDNNMNKFIASEAYLATYNGGYIGYLSERIKNDSIDNSEESSDPVTVISAALEDPSLIGMSKDEVLKALKDKLKDSEIASLTKDSKALSETSNFDAGSFIRILLLGEAKYQMSDVGNVTDKDLYYHTVGEGGGLTMPASYTGEDTVSNDFIGYEIEDAAQPVEKQDDSIGKKFSKLAITIAFMCFFIVFITIIGMWRVFAKAGESGWKVLIPILNEYTLSKIATGSALWFILLLVPFVNVAAYIVITIKLAKAFDRSAGYGIGLLILPFIFYPKLGFSEDEYIGPYGDVPGRSDVFGNDKENKSKKTGIFSKAQEDDELDNIDDEDDFEE